MDQIALVTFIHPTENMNKKKITVKIQSTDEVHAVTNINHHEERRSGLNQ